MVPNPPERPEGGFPFGDATGCKRWLMGLPRTHVSQAQQLMLDALRTLSRSVPSGLERLKCLELLREQVAYLVNEQRLRLHTKTLPLSHGDEVAWSAGRGVLEALEAGYRECLALALAAKGDLGQHLALIRQRIVRCLGAQMFFHLAVYRRFDPALWIRLHEQYSAAERDRVAEERIKDSLESSDGVSSIHDAYVNVVLMQAAYLSEMTATQMDLLDSLLRMWPRKVHVIVEPPGAAEPGSTFPLAVDFAKPIGARPLNVDDRQPTHRIFDVEELSKSIRHRVKALHAGELPVKLGLPARTSAIEALGQLGRLHQLWCEGAPPRPPAKVPDEKTAAIAFGLPEIHFFLTGEKIFEQPDRSRELSHQEKDELAMFGRVSERTQQLRIAELNFALEDWGVVDEMLGAWRLVRPQKATKGMAIGRVLAMRLGASAPFLLGVVHALVQEADGRIVITATLFPGRPEAIAVRAADARNRVSPHWAQAFRLPAIERLNVPQTLVVPTGIASRGRGVEVWEGSAREVTVFEIVERGTDFDRVAVL